MNGISYAVRSMLLTAKELVIAFGKEQITSIRYLIDV